MQIEKSSNGFMIAVYDRKQCPSTGEVLKSIENYWEHEDRDQMYRHLGYILGAFPANIEFINTRPW